MTHFIAHFHPLLVHLPIGILVLALFMSLLPDAKRTGIQSAFSLSLGFAAISSALACITGYLLSNSGDYDADLVRNHQWTGIATSILCFAAWLAPKFNRQILWATIVSLVLASHMGGTLTHGEGYLFPKNEASPVEDSSSQNPGTDTMAQLLSDTSTYIGQPQQVFLFRDQITPILKNKCYNCHSAVKKKGGLRLDSESFITKGGKNGEVLVKGEPDKSTLYKHLILPLEDDKHMPPKGKKQLSRQEIALIHRWIKKGAPFGAIEIPAVAQFQEPATIEIPQTSTTEPASEFTGPEPAPKTTKPAAYIPPPNEQRIQLLKEQGVIVEKIQDGSNALSANFVNVRELSASAIQDLNAISQQLTSLKFSGLPLTDQMLRDMESYPNLEKIHLEKTNITDQGLAELKKFPKLESLNLYGTGISDTGLKNLWGTNLKKINLWNTKVSTQGIQSLTQKNPALEIETGQLSLKKVDSTRKK